MFYDPVDLDQIKEQLDRIEAKLDQLLTGSHPVTLWGEPGSADNQSGDFFCGVPK